MKPIDKNPLSALFPGANFIRNEIVRKLIPFAEIYPEMKYDGVDSVVFSTEDMEFKIRGDYDEENMVVFKGTITGFCPETIIFDTGYKSTIKAVFKALQAGWANLK